MSVNESIVEDAALERFGVLGYAVGHGTQPRTLPWAIALRPVGDVNRTESIA